MGVSRTDHNTTEVKDMIVTVDPFGAEHLEFEPGEAPDGCPSCHQPISSHIGGKPCVDGQSHTSGGWWNLPMARSAWQGTARSKR